jgi:hypothetical protein
MYGLGTLPLIKLILNECPGLYLSPHFLDDGIFEGKVVDLEKVVEIRMREGPGYGST